MIISSFSLTEASLACATAIGAIAGLLKMSKCKVIKCCNVIECERQIDDEIEEQIDEKNIKKIITKPPDKIIESKV
jgi:hypothetical protein